MTRAQDGLTGSVWWVAGVNQLAKSLTSSRFANHEAAFAAAVRTAERRAGLRWRGDDAFLDGMRRLALSWWQVPELTAIGYQGTNAEIIRRLRNRLLTGDLFARHPDAGQAPVQAPVFVTGLPRTGTTLLHRLLVCHPGARAPVLWELLNPVPLRGAGSWAERAHKRSSARWMVRGYHALSPALPDLHPISAAGPEECVFLLPHSMAHYVRARITGYRDWYRSYDPRPDYQYHRRQLQVLQWRGPSRRWVLKSPFHLEHLDVLLETFPDATIVWTHRDPAAALTSWCRFTEAVMWLHNSRIDRAAIGTDWLEYWAQAARRAQQVRERLPPGRVIDIDYDTLIADPELPARLWRRLGEPTANPRAAEDAARGSRTRPHPAEPGRYGLHPAAIRDRFAGLWPQSTGL